MPALELDRKRLATIGLDHLHRQLTGWLATYCGSEPDPAHLRAWMEDAYRHGMLTQRATAGWTLACHSMGSDALRHDAELQGLLNLPDLPAATRTMLFEVWLAGRHAPPGGAAISTDSVLQQAAQQLADACRDTLPARAATARALDRVKLCLLLATEHLLPSIQQTLAPALPGRRKAVFERAAASLRQQLAVIQDSFLAAAADALAALPRAETDAAPANPQVSAVPAQLSTLRQACLDLAAHLRRLAEHDVPAQCERCRQALDEAEQQAASGTMATLQVAASRIDELEILLGRGLPTTAASAAAAASVAYLGCAQVADDVVDKARGQALTACVPSRIAEALATLPQRFPDLHTHRPVQSSPARSAPQRASLRAALAQVALFDIMQTIASLCPIVLARAQCILRSGPPAGQHADIPPDLARALHDADAALQSLPAMLGQGIQGLPEAIRALQADTLPAAQREALLLSWEPLQAALQRLADLRIDHPAIAAAQHGSPLYGIQQAVQACADMGRRHGLESLALARELIRQ